MPTKEHNDLPPEVAAIYQAFLPYIEEVKWRLSSNYGPPKDCTMYPQPHLEISIHKSGLVLDSTAGATASYLENMWTAAEKAGWWGAPYGELPPGADELKLTVWFKNPLQRWPKNSEEASDRYPGMVIEKEELIMPGQTHLTYDVPPQLIEAISKLRSGDPQSIDKYYWNEHVADSIPLVVTKNIWISLIQTLSRSERLERLKDIFVAVPKEWVRGLKTEAEMETLEKRIYADIVAEGGYGINSLKWNKDFCNHVADLLSVFTDTQPVKQ